MSIKDSMDGSFYHGEKLIYYLVPSDKGRVFGAFGQEKTYREFRYFNEDGTLIGTYNAYGDMVILQNITPLLAREYYVQMINK